MTECPICKASNVKEIDHLISTGEMSIDEVAESFEVSQAKVLEHFNDHMEERDSDIPSTYSEMLGDLLRKLYRRVNGILNQPVGNSREENRINSHVQSIRKLIKDIRELKGKLESSSTIKIEQAEINFNQWNAFLLQNLCNSCKEKYADWLEEQERIPAR